MAVIILCTSMCAWYITRVHNKVNSTIYMSMPVFHDRAVPDGYVLPLSKTGEHDAFKQIPSVLLWYTSDSEPDLRCLCSAGFVKSIPLEIEEAAMIDGCTPLQTFFQVVFPIMKPTYDHGGNSAGNVDLERLSAALSGAGSEKIQDHPDCHPVFKGRLRSG